MNPTESPLSCDFSSFDHTRAAKVVAEVMESAYQRVTVKPSQRLEIEPLPTKGCGLDGFHQQMSHYSAAGCGLATPLMIGHMDTAPHPLAAYADAVVSALNNNLLFRELSPAASEIEEHLVAELARRLGLHSDWHGTFCSGGSMANLTALFSATGGFATVAHRHKVALFVPECAHTSVLKSAAVLGVDGNRVHRIASDEQGRANVDELAQTLRRFRFREPDGIAVVVAVVGSTIHGAVESIDPLADVCDEYSAWLHVDAIYGAALAFSPVHGKWLRSLDRVHSVVAGPQKWMFVPRVSAVVWVKGETVFNDTLAFTNNYSANTESHRGTWGLQGSRRADAVTLWAVLNYVGTDALGEEVDAALAKTEQFHQLLEGHSTLQPAHSPDLNLQCFNYRDAEHQPSVETSQYKQLGIGELPWVSVSRWRDADYFRAVVLSPRAGNVVFERLLDALG